MDRCGRLSVNAAEDGIQLGFFGLSALTRGVTHVRVFFVYAILAAGVTAASSFGRGRNPASSLSVGVSRQPTHVRVFFRPPSWRSGHFLLLAQEKVTKEKGALAAAVAGDAGDCASA